MASLYSSLSQMVDDDSDKSDVNNRESRSSDTYESLHQQALDGAGHVESKGTLCHSSLEKCIPLDNHLRFVLASPNQMGPHDASPSVTGFLYGCLPPELWINIFSSTDIETLTTFRRVSKSMRGLVSADKKYAAIVKHVPPAIRALLATRAAGWTTVEQLYTLLTTPECTMCAEEENPDNFGQFMCMLPPVRRVCWTHLIRSERFRPVTLEQAETDLKIPLSMKKDLQLLNAIPVTAGIVPDQKILDYVVLVRKTQRVSSFYARPGQYIIPSLSYTTCRFYRQPMVGYGDDTVEQVLEGYCDTHYDNPVRLMTATRLPYLRVGYKDRRVDEAVVEWGVPCIYCTPGPGVDSHAEEKKMYSEEQFQEHYNACDGVRLWRHARRTMRRTIRAHVQAVEAPTTS